MFRFLLIGFSLFHLTLSDKWYSKSQCTQKEFANYMNINCNLNEFILIGWSHYGTKKQIDKTNSSSLCQPSENDCIMDYTHKIAELCNGMSKCEVILTQQFIHKCSDEATYLFLSYQCIPNSSIMDICSKNSIISSNGINLISPMFPNEYPNNINCTCSVESKDKSNVTIEIETLSFNLQDNDKLLSFSGTVPFGASFFTAKNQLNLNFQTDETLTQSGFWIRLYGYHQCNNDEYSLGSKCIKIFPKKQTWKSARDICLSIDSKLLNIQNIIQEKKLAYFISTSNDQLPTSFWIADEKNKYDGYSWWPWRSSSINGNCVLRAQDGWIKRSCNEEQAFICERDVNRHSIPLTIRCGNTESIAIASTKTVIATTTSTTQKPTKPLVQQDNIVLTTSEINLPIKQLSSTMYNKLQTTKTTTMYSSILAAIIAGILVVIFFVNIVVCYICKRRIQTQSQCKTQNDSNSSFTHEELQHSLMQHLYHEQTNTISSRSTSSSSSKHSKSNDTTSTNLFQLSSLQSNLPSTTLCFKNPNVNHDSIEYHVYETIPAENTNHSAFKPVTPSNIQNIRPYLPRTNILYHPSDPSKHSYSTLAPNMTVVMPVYCQHCSTGTLRQHVSSLPPQIYTRPESIV